MRNAVFVLTMIALPVVSSAGAEQTPAPKTRVKTAATKTPTGGPLAATVVLAQETRIDPVLVLKVANGADPHLKDDVLALQRRAEKVLGVGWGSFWYACHFALENMKNCSRKAFSAADQNAAGCLPTETVQACSEKLLKWCVYGPHGNDGDNCRTRRPPLLKDLESLEVQIRLIRPRVAVYADF